jgi:UV DNA damage endonuclease
MIRFGLCCKFQEAPIKFRTTTVTYLKRLIAKGEDPKKHLRNIIADNIEALYNSIDYCTQNGIGSFRINSNFFPAITHPDAKYTLDDFENSTELFKRLADCKETALNKNIRLVMHPDQFILLSSPSDDITNRSIDDLIYHSYLAELVGVDVINIHVGGAYGDKPSAINRVIKNFEKLPAPVKARLTLENDDKTYSPSELLFICTELDIPFVYDVHHHRCHKDELSTEKATEKALLTWNREPLFHISSPINGWGNPHTNRHHDYININDFPKCWLDLKNVTIEVEAKAKEVAIKQLQQELKITW